MKKPSLAQLYINTTDAAKSRSSVVAIQDFTGRESQAILNPAPYTKFVPYMNLVQIDDVVEEIESFRQLKDCWDGYAAAAFDQATIDNALNIFLQNFSATPYAVITPNEHGTISLEWRSSRGSAHLEIGKTKFSMFIRNLAGRVTPYEGKISEFPTTAAERLKSVLFPEMEISQKPPSASVLVVSKLVA